MKKEFNKQFETILIKIISIVSMLLGIFLAIFLILKMLFKDYKISDTEMKITGVLLFVGLIGTVLESIFKKVIQSIIEKYLPEEKVNEIIRDEVMILKEKEEEEERINETEKSDDLDTVIVPFSETDKQVKKTKKYICPANNRYTFKKGLKYIAFYKNMEICGYGKIKEGFPNDINGVRIFEIESFQEIKIPHLKKGAFVQRKSYCKLEKLLRAKNTSEIK